LVHSSTLVTAGVYLLIRFNYLLGERIFLFFISLITILMSGYGANFETDLKKIIALSTLSQLGVIIITLSLGFYELSFFHLLRHALFKSLLFLCSGVIIHGIGDVQDIRFIGGLIIGLPLISVFFIGSSLALCGFPFLAGFYSKDLILEIYFIGSINYFILLILYLATIITITYSLRLIYFLFFKNIGIKSSLILEEESGIYVPMFFLFFISLFSGSLLSWVSFPLFLVLLPSYLKNIVIIGLIFFRLFVSLKVLRNNILFNLNLKISEFFSGRI
jgi:NADH-ubiquinone oxidoreductase chain 5